MTTLEFEEFTGYKFELTEEPNSLGRTIICTAYDNNGDKLTDARASYANGSGYGYAKAGVIESAKSSLKHLIETNFQKETEEPYDTDFLYRLTDRGYIRDYGELGSTGELVIIFDSWSEVEGEGERKYVEGKGMVKTGNFKKSVYAKLVELADKNLLKPSINRTIKEIEYVFSDTYEYCDRCGKWFDREWDGIHYIESMGERVCDHCLNEDSSIVANLIKDAQEDFKKALPAGINEDIIEELGYVKVDPNDDFSTRYSEWNESNWGCHNISLETIEDICKEYGGFPKITEVWQFECIFNLYFPAETVKEARIELGIDNGDSSEDN